MNAVCRIKHRWVEIIQNAQGDLCRKPLTIGRYFMQMYVSIANCERFYPGRFVLS